jgi:hypothetical protein
VLYRSIPYWSTSLARVYRNVWQLLEGRWDFEHLADLEIPRPAIPNISNSVLKDIQDESLAGKNISM